MAVTGIILGIVLGVSRLHGSDLMFDSYAENYPPVTIRIGASTANAAPRSAPTGYLRKDRSMRNLPARLPAWSAVPVP